MSSVRADEPATPAKQPAPTRPAEPAKPTQPTNAEPTLDDLLGTKKPTSTTPPTIDPAATRPATPSRDDLDRRLRQPEPSDTLKEAVALMEQAATRLGTEGGNTADTSLDTQRVQEDVLRKLDQALSQARKKRSQQQQKQQQQQQQQQEQKQQQDQQQQDQKQSEQDQATQQSRAQKAKDSSDTSPHEGREQALGPNIEAARAAWGSLPQRTRDMLMQGSGEKFSSSYQRLTEEYYKRLAEQKPKR